MEEEFVLHKYWCLEITKDNIDLIQKWRFDTFKFDDDLSNYKYVYYDGEAGSGAGSWGVLDLTTEQFITYVLKEPIITQIPIDETHDELVKLLNELNIK